MVYLGLVTRHRRDHEDYVEREIAGEETEVETENHFENSNSKTVGFDFVYKWIGDDEAKGLIYNRIFCEKKMKIHFAKYV